MRKTTILALALAAGAALLMLSAPERALAGPQRLVFTDTSGSEIIGEVQKPEVAVFISRQNLNKAYQLELKESFLPKIIESVNKPPF